MNSKEFFKNSKYEKAGNALRKELREFLEKYLVDIGLQISENFAEYDTINDLLQKVKYLSSDEDIIKKVEEVLFYARSVIFSDRRTIKGKIENFAKAIDDLYSVLNDDRIKRIEELKRNTELLCIPYTDEMIKIIFINRWRDVILDIDSKVIRNFLRNNDRYSTVFSYERVVKEYGSRLVLECIEINNKVTEDIYQKVGYFTTDISILSDAFSKKDDE